jgi:hypothetical protein
MNTHLEELACLYVLDRLDAPESASFEARLPHDPELRALTRELEDALSRRIHALPQVEPPAGLLAGIEGRIDRLSAGAPARAASPAWASVARWGMAAVIAVGIGILAIQSLRRPPASAERPYLVVVGLDSLNSRLAQLPMPDRPGSADASFIRLASLAERFWEKPEDMPVKLDPATQGGRGYALFDPGSNQGFIAIRQLPMVEQGKRYHLWLLDTASGQVRQAGALPTAGSASGLYFFSVAPAGGQRVDRLDFFMTSEDASAPDSAQPHGRVVLGDRRI